MTGTGRNDDALTGGDDAMGPGRRHPTPAVGSRVVLRFRREPGSVPSQSDALGTLVALSPLVRVRTADGSEVSVEPGRVVVLKSVPPRPVRTSSIRALESAIAWSRPDIETAWVSGWVARADGADPLAGGTATPLADPSMPEGDFFHDLLDTRTLDRLDAWFTGRDLPLTLRLPDRLVRPPAEWHSFGEHLVLTADLPLRVPGRPTGAVTGPATRVTAGATASATAGHGGAARVPLDAAGCPMDVAARISEGSDGRVWAVLTVESAERERGRAAGAAHDDGADGMGAAVEALCRWAARSGAAGAVLAVLGSDGVTGGDAAGKAGGDADSAATGEDRHDLRIGFEDAAVRALGFADHHRCRYVRLHPAL
ncbi:GNAT family N-acetyltransferase, cg3035/Rv0428c family [Tomitella gaofuii]|uniref:GNAT family N-acetyltransferase, cg3035/Rv0428c family n=1 Tax=Tomitella gaofuii TaxID=2760083 RepID=UPI0015FAE49B|nr:hypothetical protein [Tomitella gaofuii]